MKFFRANITVGFLLVLPLVGSAFPINPFVAHADNTSSTASSTVSTTPVIASDCAITTTDLATITTAEEQGLQAELAARKTLLAQVIGCAITDAQTLQTTLNATPATGNAVTIQSQLSGKLDDAISYYNLELQKVNASGIGGTEVVARAMLSWRQGNYDPLAAQVSNFILWSENQALFATANARFGQIEGIVSFVDQAAPNTGLEGDIANAQSLIQTAEDQNTSAEQALSQFVPADQSLALIQQSLQSLAAAYKKFSDISTTVQALLPPAQSGS